MEKILSTLVSFPTITVDQEANKKAIEWIDRFLSERAMHVKRFSINGTESIVATTQHTTTPKVLLAAHLDVVPATEAQFTLKKQKGRYYGRGVFDMKFAIAAYLQLVDDLQDSLPNYDFGIMITSDEEVGGFNGTKALIDKGFVPEIVILPDGGDSPTGWKFERSAKGMFGLAITTTGISAHGSRPWKGENAVDKLMDLLGDLKKDFRDQTPDTNTISVGKIEGGTAFNQVPASATAYLNIRTISDDDAKAIWKRLSAICTLYEAQISHIFPYAHASRADKKHALVDAFFQAIHKVITVELTEQDSQGSSDARFFAAKKVPCIVISPPGDGYHAEDEWVSQKGVEELLEILRLYIDHTANIKTG